MKPSHALTLRLGLIALLLPALAAMSAKALDASSVALFSESLPTGAFTVTSSSPTQVNFTVSCSTVRAALGGSLLIQQPAGSPRGLVMFFSGLYGVNPWSTNSMAASWLGSLAGAGYEVVQVTWAQPGWEAASPGEDAGQAHVACRPATAVQWVHDNLYAGLHVPAHGAGVCGFCITGNSGGASQVSYPLAYYGLGSILDGVFPTSGPPHAALAKGCLNQAGYEYGPLALGVIDSSNGYFGGTGPCTKHDPSFTNRWNQESVDTNGGFYYYPSTRLHFIFGAADTQTAKQHAEDYIAKIAGSPMVSQETVSTMAHDIEFSSTGLAALLAAIEVGAPPPPPPSPSPSPTPAESPSPSPSPSPGSSSPRPGGAHSSTPLAKTGSQHPGQSPAPGASSLPGPLKGVVGAIAPLASGSAPRGWLWVIVLGLALAVAAVVLLPRATLLQGVRKTRPGSVKGPPPSS